MASWFGRDKEKNTSIPSLTHVSTIAMDSDTIWVTTVTNDEVKEILSQYETVIDSYHNLYGKFDRATVSRHLKLFNQKVMNIDRLSLNEKDARSFYNLLHTTIPKILNQLGTEMLEETFYPPVEFKEKLEEIMTHELDTYPVLVYKKSQRAQQGHLADLLQAVRMNHEMKTKVHNVFALCEKAAKHMKTLSDPKDRFFVTQTHSTYLPEILRSYTGILNTSDADAQKKADEILNKQLDIITDEITRIISTHGDAHMKDMNMYLNFLQDKINAGRG